MYYKKHGGGELDGLVLGEFKIKKRALCLRTNERIEISVSHRDVAESINK
jgi:hypothetical protein